MKRTIRIGAGVVVCALAGLASAQPTLTSLGSGSPLSVTNLTGGSYIIGGSGQSTTAAARWTLTGSIDAQFEKHLLIRADPE